MSCTGSAQFELTVGGFPNLPIGDANSPEFNELFDVDSDIDVADLLFEGSMIVLDNGFRLQDPIDPQLSNPFPFVTNSTSSDGSPQTEYLAPNLSGFVAEIKFESGDSVRIEGDATVRFTLFDQFDLGGTFVDFGILSVSFSNSDLVDAGLVDPAFTGGLTFQTSMRYHESVLTQDPVTEYVEPAGAGTFDFTNGSFFLGETNNFNNIFFNSVAPVIGTTKFSSLSGPPPCPEDLNGNGIVELFDLLILLANFGQFGGQGDITSDGVVDLVDLLQLLSVFGTNCH